MAVDQPRSKFQGAGSRNSIELQDRGSPIKGLQRGRAGSLRSSLAPSELSISEDEQERQDQVMEMQKNKQPSVLTLNVPFVRKKTSVEKKKAFFEAIKMQTTNDVVDPQLLAVNNNNDDRFDEQGRIIRWKRILEYGEQEEHHTRCCRQGERVVSDVEADAYLESFNEELYERLMVRKKAISNWKRLKIVIVILRMCNGKMNEDEKEKEEEEEKEDMEATFKFDLLMSKYIRLPNDRYILIWSVFMSIIYLASIFIDTVIIAFDFEPMTDMGMATAQSVLSLIMFFDICVTFFTSVPRQSEIVEDSESEDDFDQKQQMQARSKV